MSTPAKHLTIHAVEVIKSEKNSKSAPVIIAPITLVAANVIANKIIEVRTVPKTPAIASDSGALKQRHLREL